MKLLVTLFSFTLAFHTLIAGAQENAPLSAPFPTGFVLGDRWEWNVKSDPDQGGYSTKTREVIMSRSRQILMFRVDADSNNPVYFKNEFETNPFFQTKSLTPFREWPLTVGKTWEYSGEFMSGGGVARVNQSAKVVAFEDISVPAGTFRAFKIMYSGVVSEQGRSWGRVDTHWYAPSVKADVKSTVDMPTQTELRELVSYKPGQAPIASKADTDLLQPVQMAKFLTYVWPSGAASAEAKGAKYPVVFLFQGSGGNNSRSQSWATWFSQLGVASVMVDSAGFRGMKTLFGIDYGSDLKSVLEAVQNNPKLDLDRYAIMGFSRGGTAALESGSFLMPTQPKPDFIFALYPGDSGRCPNKYELPTKVLVFYGDLDDYGDFMGTRIACSQMPPTNSNTTFVLMKNAHHGYDGTRAEKWECCGNRTFTSEPNADALEITRNVISTELQKKWGLSPRN